LSAQVESGARRYRGQVGQRYEPEQEHHVLRRHVADRRLAQGADQKHREHDGEDDDERRTECAGDVSTQGGIE